MRIELAKDFFVEVSEETVKNDIDLRVRLYLNEVRKAIEVARASEFNSEGYRKAVAVADKLSQGWEGEGVCTGLLDYCAYDENYRHLWKECYELYNEMNIVEHYKYKERYEAEFLEYASHKDEPDFDWGFYSDWHKDIYGYRPR